MEKLGRYRHILFTQLLVEYAHVADLLASSGTSFFIPDYSMRYLQKAFSTYHGSMTYQQADSVICRVMINSYVALLDAKDQTGKTGMMCRKFVDEYRTQLNSIDAKKWLTSDNLMAFFDSRNYSIYALLHENQDADEMDGSRTEVICDIDHKSGLVKGHVFVHYNLDTVELIGIQTDLYHSISGERLGFSSKAFDHILKGLDNTVRYVYAVAWRTISEILVKKYGFQTLQYDAINDMYIHSTGSGSTRYEPPGGTRPPPSELVDIINLFNDYIYEEYVTACSPSCYIFTYRSS
jgi:hypothetical protein